MLCYAKGNKLDVSFFSFYTETVEFKRLQIIKLVKNISIRSHDDLKNEYKILYCCKKYIDKCSILCLRYSGVY